ncbi:hypothetical protein K493DRAFT_110427 [Basidiobolus meristosporus CBS 931.73]|uniref:Sec7-domain-containing protein n=1 Tax=Basidiobolus meristosporus CBS 931.73 TaxID=1314790 RepID=A0A1Y1YNG5_9FUNG|nr:hypothetical protein K493DRAFT_110427 [Basidiobolus meristosporus CBS 931.73]|eukprot:ORX99373.1 hypothetical protein K493DRAFT_110427 [Basidiobolus meristosporus CBS 931.73]
MASTNVNDALFEAPPPYTKSSPEEARANRTTTTITTFTRTLPLNQRPNSLCIDLGDGHYISVLDRKAKAQAAAAKTRISANEIFEDPLARRSSRLTISVTIEEVDDSGNQEEHVSTIHIEPPTSETRSDDLQTEIVENNPTSVQPTENTSVEIPSTTTTTTNTTDIEPIPNSTNEKNDDSALSQQLKDICFVGEPIDMALRKFLAQCELPKEAQQIDRVMQAFAEKYHSENPHLFLLSDVVYSVAFSLMLLHTDAHNKHVKQKMSKQQYVRQTRMLEQTDIVAPEILEILYDNVTTVEFSHGDKLNLNIKAKSTKISWLRKMLEKSSDTAGQSSTDVATRLPTDVLASKLSLFEPERGQYSYRGSQSIIREAFLKTALKLKTSPIKASDISRPESKLSPLDIHKSKAVRENEDPFSVLKCIKAGLVRRKCDLVDGGKRANIRSWKKLWVVLSGHQLVFFHEGPAKKSTGKSNHNELVPSAKPHSIIPTDNCISLIDKDYNTYPHVFRFVTPTKREFLFRFDSEEDMIDWMAKINYVAAFQTVGIEPRGSDGLSKSKVSELTAAELAEQEQKRHALVQSQVEELNSRILKCQESLDSDGLLQKQISVMIPLQRRTQQKAIDTAADITRRLKETYLELQKWRCYKEILEADLVISEMAMEKCHREESPLHAA